MTHELKILEDFADAVNRGDKTFEIRENDRGFQKGDRIKFIVRTKNNYVTLTSHPLSNKIFEITYVINGWGLKNGFVAFGIKEIKE